MRVLVTGAAGFIGYHLSKRLLKDGHTVSGIDNLNAYYDVALKKARIANLVELSNFSFTKLDLNNSTLVSALLKSFSADCVIHLAAQAGVRYSKKNPQSYLDSNVTGFLSILEACRNANVTDLYYASSSSVYGGNKTIPFSESQPVDRPTNIYAASKRMNELMAHSYHNLYGINSVGLRFFTVYGPWGRPDMAYYFFTEKIQQGEEITVFNNGEMSRDFTYVDDVVDGINSIVETTINKPDYLDIVNLGNNKPEKLMSFIHLLESSIGRKALIKFEPAQAEEMIHTWADISKAQTKYNYSPKTSLKVGLQNFTDWYADFMKK